LLSEFRLLALHVLAFCNNFRYSNCVIYKIARGGIYMAQSKKSDMGERQEMEAGQATGRDLLTVREVARNLRVDDTTVRRWIKSGALDAVALPHTGKRCGYRVRKNTLDALFSSPVALQ
jgi:excisionase family DNA binding protein